MLSLHSFQVPDVCVHVLGAFVDYRSLTLLFPWFLLYTLEQIYSITPCVSTEYRVQYMRTQSVHTLTCISIQYIVKDPFVVGCVINNALVCFAYGASLYISASIVHIYFVCIIYDCIVKYTKFGVYNTGKLRGISTQTRSHPNMYIKYDQAGHQCVCDC